MIKQINKLLKLVGLNLVRAKRKSVKVPPCAAMTAPVNFGTLERYTPEDKVPLADYMGDSEWHNAPGPEGPTGSGVQKTHYVGDDCPGGHRDLVGADDHEMTRAEHFDTAGGTTPEQNEARFDRPAIPQPNSDNKITGPTS